MRLSDDTIIVHTSDHGDSLGAHHLFAKEVMFEEAARVPLLIRLPGQKRGKIDSATGESHRFRTDIARSSWPAKAPTVRGQEPAAAYPRRSPAAGKCIHRVGP